MAEGVATAEDQRLNWGNREIGSARDSDHKMDKWMSSECNGNSRNLGLDLNKKGVWPQNFGFYVLFGPKGEFGCFGYQTNKISVEPKR